MATREENLKKINEQLEQLSDEELEKVAGGVTDIPTSIQIGIPLIPKNKPKTVS